MCGRKSTRTLADGAGLGAARDSVVRRANIALSALGLLFLVGICTREWLLQCRGNGSGIWNLVDVALGIIGTGRRLLLAASSQSALQRLRLSSSSRFFRERWNQWPKALDSIDARQIIIVRKLVP